MKGIRLHTLIQIKEVKRRVVLVLQLIGLKKILTREALKRWGRTSIISQKRDKKGVN